MLMRQMQVLRNHQARVYHRKLPDQVDLLAGPENTFSFNEQAVKGAQKVLDGEQVQTGNVYELKGGQPPNST